MSDAQLDSTYARGAATCGQVARITSPTATSNSYTRFRLAPTENHPTIKPYD